MMSRIASAYHEPIVTVFGSDENYVGRLLQRVLSQIGCRYIFLSDPYSFPTDIPGPVVITDPEWESFVELMLDAIIEASNPSGMKVHRLVLQVKLDSVDWFCCESDQDISLSGSPDDEALLNSWLQKWLPR